jgi:hypothetical protein
MGYTLYIRDTLGGEQWQGYFSYNQSVNKKYWSVVNHWNNRNVKYVTERLTKAINKLESEGVVASMEKNCWETDIETFLYLLKDLLQNVRRWPDNYYCDTDGCSRPKYDYTDTDSDSDSDDDDGNPPENDDDEYVDDGNPPENDDDEYVDGGNPPENDDEDKEELQNSAGFPVRTSIFGTVILRSESDAAALYFKLIRLGRTDEDREVSYIKQIATFWPNIEYVVP